MTVPTGSPMPEPDSAPGVPVVEPNTPPEPEAPATPAAPVTRSLEDSLTALDEDTRNHVLAEVARSRREAADARGAKTRAANDARAEVAQTIGKALGLVPEESDPAKVSERLAAVTTEAQQAKVELAVFRAAEGKANAAALLDSRSFAQKIATVDPTDAVAITAAITAAVAENPAFGLPESRRLPAPNPAQGGAALGGAPSLDDQIAAAQKACNFREVIRLNNQKLAAPQR